MGTEAKASLNLAVQPSRIITVNVRFTSLVSKERTVILEEGTSPAELIATLRESPQGINEWDRDCGRIVTGRGKKQRLLARWATTYPSDFPLGAEELDVVVRHGDGQESCVETLKFK